jgi:uncharacterized protein
MLDFSGIINYINSMISRDLLQRIRNNLFKGKAVIVIGPRQSGKTTLMKMIAGDSKEPATWLNCDEPDIRELLANATSTRLASIIGKNRMVVIDEAQRVADIGITLKLIVDQIKDVQLLVTGSSSFDLTGKINEPLTGRKYEYHLYPISFNEMARHTSLIEEKRLLEHRIVYGYYPGIVTRPGEEKELLSLLSDSYLYKDILIHENIKKPEKLEKLLQALALQIGNEVRYHEIGQLIGADNETVERYVTILERAYIIFRLPSLSRNMRNEIRKGRKLFFFDNGIRNAIIKNFNPPGLRQDTGALWENFLISERVKNNEYRGIACNYFFWRTTTRQEIDFIEERDGMLFAYEFKWSGSKNPRAPKSFLDAYPESKYSVVNRENFTGAEGFLEIKNE